MNFTIEALVELKATKTVAEGLAERVTKERGLAARIANNGTGNMTNVPRMYSIILRGTSESEEKAEILLDNLRSMMKNYGKNGNHSVVAASSVDPIIPETQAKAPVPHAYQTGTRVRQNYRRRAVR